MAIFDGRPRDALRRIEQALPEAEAAQRVARQIKLLILRALAHDAAGRRSDSVASLEAAVLLAQPGEFVRCFLDEGERVPELLTQTKADRAHTWERKQRSYIDTLLAAAGQTQGKPPLEGEVFEPLDPLTSREEQIIGLLATGASNKVIGKKLFVSENTVKYHLKNVYSKLGVNSRVQAIRSAREMGLIQ